MSRSVALTALVISAGAAEAAVTLPVQGHAALTATGETLATVGGSVTFDAEALASGADFTPVETLTLKIDVADVGRLPPGRYVVDETDPAFEDTPQIWRSGDRFELEVQASESLAGMDYTILASPFDAGWSSSAKASRASPRATSRSCRCRAPCRSWAPPSPT